MVVVVDLVDLVGAGTAVVDITKTFLYATIGLAVVAASVTSRVLLVEDLFLLCLCLRLPFDLSLDLPERQGPLFRKRMARKGNRMYIYHLGNLA